VASLRLLEQLVRQRISHLLIVAVYSTEDLGDDPHGLLQVLDALAPWIDDRLEIPPLGPIHLHQMASALGGQIPPDFGLWLYGETRGNPLHAEQLMQAYVQGPGETHHPKPGPATRSLRDVILWRLENLPPGVLATLRQAAVLGHSFDLDHLCAALDRPETEVLDNLHSAMAAVLIRGHPTKDRHHFCHPLVREVVYAEMLSSVRKSYHWRAALVLERESAPGPLDTTIDLLAHHFWQAGEHDKALTYLARATRRARRLGAYDAALGYVDNAQAVVTALMQLATSEHQHEQRRQQWEDLEAARIKLEELAAKETASSSPKVTRLTSTPTR
jgi:predicted ATPase